jgi:hypothetical protein
MVTATTGYVQRIEDVKQSSRLTSYLRKGIYVLGALAISAACGLAFNIGANQYFNNSEYIDGDCHSIKRPVGLFDSVKMIQSGTGNRVTREIKYERLTGLMSSIVYSDEASYPNHLDGLTDQLVIFASDKIVVVERETGYSDFKSEFERGDQILTGQKAKHNDFFK